MKFMHIADLHIGKRLFEHLFIDDQRFVFAQMHDIAKKQQVDGVLVAGDVFDRANPSGEALALCEELYAGFIDAGIPVFVIPGNHDSAQQVAYNSSLAERAGLHVARAYRGSFPTFRLEDEEGPVDIHLLPFVTPSEVRMAHEPRRDEIKDYNDAVRVALEEHPLDPTARNILVAHQFVVNGGIDPETCQSEIGSVGGLDHVQAALFDAYDYVALGHLHGPQKSARETVRYAGSPIKYSFSECNHTKSVTIVEFAGHHHEEVIVSAVPLTPLREMREVTALFEELEAGIDTGNHEDYLHVILKDESLYDAMNRVRSLYPNALKLDWADVFTLGGGEDALTLERIEQRSIEELFSDYIAYQTGRDITEEEMAIFNKVRSGKGGAE